VLVGAVNESEQMIKPGPEMQFRLAEVEVPMMTADELGSILDNGQMFLGVDFSAVRERLLNVSSGVPAVMHQLALNLCRQANINATTKSGHRFVREDLGSAVEMWVDESSVSLRAGQRSAIRGGSPRDEETCQLILKRLALGPVTGLEPRSLVLDMRKEGSRVPLERVLSHLAELTQDDRGAVIVQSRSGEYRFVDPLHRTYAQATLTELGGQRFGTSRSGTARPAQIDAAIKERIAELMTIAGESEKGQARHWGAS
ncbi:MAG: hypothetical protein ACHQ50_13005, partial [Fimbriimonadales bacterium]